MKVTFKDGSVVEYPMATVLCHFDGKIARLISGNGEIIAELEEGEIVRVQASDGTDFPVMPI